MKSLLQWNMRKKQQNDRNLRFLILTLFSPVTLLNKKTEGEKICRTKDNAVCCCLSAACRQNMESDVFQKAPMIL